MMRQHTRVTRQLTTGWLETGDRSGRGPIFVFIHGCPDDASIWEAQLKYFGARGLALAPYLRGIGPSEAPRDTGARTRFGTAAFALDLLEILQEVDPQGEREVVLVGHDLGGAYVWRLAGLLGDRLRLLTVINGASPAQLFKRWMTNRKQLAKSWYIGLFLMPGLAEGFLKLFGSRTTATALARGEAPEGVGPAAPIERYLPHYRALVREFNRADTVLPCPVLLISGTRDPFLEPPSEVEVSALAANVTIRVVEGGHWIQATESEKINALIELSLGGAKAWQTAESLSAKSRSSSSPEPRKGSAGLSPISTSPEAHESPAST